MVRHLPSQRFNYNLASSLSHPRRYADQDRQHCYQLTKLRLDHRLKEIMHLLKAAMFTDYSVSHSVLTTHYKQATVGTEC